MKNQVRSKKIEKSQEDTEKRFRMERKEKEGKWVIYREVGHLQEELSPGGDEATPMKGSKPPKDFKIKTFHLALPMLTMLTKKSLKITKATIEMVLRLRIDGYTVSRIHSDQGQEFSSQFAAYCRKRRIMLTKTAGNEPQANSRAESTIKRMKTMVE